MGEGVEAILEEGELSEEEREEDISEHSLHAVRKKYTQSRIYFNNTQQLLNYKQFIQCTWKQT